jgi:hypothetical protein
MGKLAELAKASKGLKGRVAVTFADGSTRTFDDEAAAEAATAGLNIEHRRGAFYEVAAKALEPASKAAPKKK